MAEKLVAGKLLNQVGGRKEALKTHDIRVGTPIDAGAF